MEKKFFDIKPKKVEIKKQHICSEEKKNKKPILYSLVSLSVLVLVFGLFFLFSGNFKIEVIPDIEEISFQENIFLDPEVEVTSFSNKNFAVQEIEDTLKDSQEFLTTGKTVQEERASGVIRVYNEHSTEDQVLVANTRFMSSEGKLFRSVQQEVISGGTYKEGDFVSGYTDIQVRAAETGPEYNIGPTTFSIPGFANTAKYTTFYGESLETMTGGKKQEVSQVSQGDLNQAEEKLKKRLKQEIKKDLNIPSGFDLLESTLNYQILSIDFDTEAGTIQGSFNLEMEIKITGYAISQKEIQKFAQTLALEDLENKVIKPDSLLLDYELEGEKELRVFFSLAVYPEIDILELKKEIAAQPKDKILDILEKKEEIIKAEFSSWPFLRQRASGNLQDIEINIKVD